MAHAHVHYDLDELERRVRESFEQSLAEALTHPGANKVVVECQTRANEIVVAQVRFLAAEYNLGTDLETVFGIIGITAARLLKNGAMNAVQIGGAADGLCSIMLQNFSATLNGALQSVGNENVQFHGTAGGRA